MANQTPRYYSRWAAQNYDTWVSWAAEQHGVPAEGFVRSKKSFDDLVRRKKIPPHVTPQNRFF